MTWICDSSSAFLLATRLQGSPAHELEELQSAPINDFYWTSIQARINLNPVPGKPGIARVGLTLVRLVHVESVQR
jgi:hypothetical protein